MKDVTLYMLCGLPASGKTTIAKQFEKELGVKRHSYDDVLSKFNYTNTWGKWIDNIKNDLKNGYDVICDNTNLFSWYRKSILTRLSNINCRKILIIVNTPIKQCVKNNQNRNFKTTTEVIYDCSKNFEEPCISEGWDEIYYICHK